MRAEMLGPFRPRRQLNQGLPCSVESALTANVVPKGETGSHRASMSEIPFARAQGSVSRIELRALVSTEGNISLLLNNATKPSIETSFNRNMSLAFL